jgi:PKHD-type hydroxylase
MIFTIDDLLTPDELNLLNQNLNPDDFIDGKTTAGWHAKLVKENTQLKQDAPQIQDLRQIAIDALKRNPIFEIGIRPKIVHSLLFSRYTEGMSYGSHVDNAFMGKEYFRSDVSFTIFLSPPDSYQGGELAIESFEGEQTFKLEAGSIVLYPSSSLHRVEKVTAGVRLVAVGWIQSLIRHSYQREILFDLDTARRSIFAQQGKTVEFDLISKSLANLLRLWAD